MTKTQNMQRCAEFMGLPQKLQDERSKIVTSILWRRDFWEIRKHFSESFDFENMSRFVALERDKKRETKEKKNRDFT